MSATVPVPPTATTTNAITQATGKTSLVTNLGDALASGARDAPDAIRAVAQLNPALADKALAQSKTLYGIIAVQGLTALVHYMGWGWAPDVVAEVAGAVVLICLRLATSAPITAWFSTGKTPAVAPVTGKV
jgi:hypothetical protein